MNATVTEVSSSILQLKCKKNYASVMKQHKLHNHAWNVFHTDIWCERPNKKMFRRNMFA